MNNLVRTSVLSARRDGEQLCGDHGRCMQQGDRSTIVVLADGMGSASRLTFCRSHMQKSSPL
jgi:hypothetical protein